jgi:hypothetical protein
MGSKPANATGTQLRKAENKPPESLPYRVKHNARTYGIQSAVDLYGADLPRKLLLQMHFML